MRHATGVLLAFSLVACSKDEPKKEKEPGGEAAAKVEAPPAEVKTEVSVARPPTLPEADFPAAKRGFAKAEARVNVQRRFDAQGDNTAADPPAGAADGDLIEWGDCGLYTDYATQAYYLVCGGALASGPIRSQEELEVAVAARESGGAQPVQPTQPAQPTTPTTTTTAPTATTGGTDCDTAVRRAYQLVEQTGSASMKQAANANPAEGTIKACVDEAWAAEIRDCLMKVTTAEQIYYDCYSIPLIGESLTIGRRFDATRLSGTDVNTQDGDFAEFVSTDGKPCGLLFKKKSPAYAFFYLCNGGVQGPIMTSDDYQSLIAAMAQDEENRHKIVKSLIAKTKVGRFGGQWKVCDQYNNCHIE